MNKKTILTMILTGFLGLTQAQNTNTSSEHVKSATAISKVLGDGRKVTTVVLEYDSPISNKSLSTDSYRVEGKEVTRVYANTRNNNTRHERTICNHRSESRSRPSSTTQTTHSG